VDAPTGRVFVVPYGDPCVEFCDGPAHLVVLNARLTEVVKRIRVPGSLGSIAIDSGSQRAYVLGDDGVVVVSTRSLEVVGLFRFTGRATDIAVDTAADRVDVVTHGGILIVIDARSGHVVARRKVGKGGRTFEEPAVAVDPRSHRVFGTDPATHRLWAVGAGAHLVGSARFPDDFLEDVAIDRIHHVAYVAADRRVNGSYTGSLFAVDTRTLKVKSKVEVGSVPYRLAVDAHRSRIYVSDNIENVVWVVSASSAA
jgi:YVTN family beta-propeller protein